MNLKHTDLEKNQIYLFRSIHEVTGDSLYMIFMEEIELSSWEEVILTSDINSEPC